MLLSFEGLAKKRSPDYSEVGNFKHLSHKHKNMVISNSTIRSYDQVMLN